MSNLSSPAALLPLITAFNETVQRRAGSPDLTQDILNTLLAHLPEVTGAALFALDGKTPQSLAQIGSLSEVDILDTPALNTLVAKARPTTGPAPAPLTDQLDAVPFSVGEIDQRATHLLLIHRVLTRENHLYTTLQAVAQLIAPVLHLQQALTASTANLQAQTRLSQSLSDIALSLSAALDPDMVMQQAADSLYQALNVDHIGVVLFSPDHTSGEVVAEAPHQEAIGVTLDLTDYPVQQYLEETHQTFICEDLATDPRMVAVREPLQALGIQALMIVPIVISNELIGSVGLDLIEEKRAFTDEEIMVAEAAAAQLAISVQNANLFAAAQQREVELEEHVAGRTAELRASEAELRALFAAMDDVIIIYDVEGRYMQVAPTNPRLLYRPTLDLIGKTVHEVLPAEVADMFVHYIGETLQSGKPTQVEYELEINGEQTWFTATASPLENELVLWVARDITARKVAEAQMQLSATVVENSATVVFRWQAAESWPVEFVSSNVQDVFGYSVNDLISGDVPYTSIIHPHDLNRVLEEVAHYTATGVDSFQQEYRILTKDGSVRWTDDRITIIRDAAGQLAHYEGVVIDITERRRAQEALEEQRAFLRRVIDLNPAFVFTKDWEGRYTLVNQALADSLNQPVEQVLGKTDADFGLDLDRVEQIMADDREVMRSGQARLIPEEKMIDTHTGEEIWLQTIKVPLATPEGDIQLMGISTDITARKHLELQIQESLERRGREIRIATEIAQEIAAAPRLEDLFEWVVTLTKDWFNFAHTQIFRYSPEADVMQLVVGYGPVGAKMRADGHHLPTGRGVVGTAAATGRPVLASDVRQDPDWVPHPDLPETQGELAVPIKLRNKVLGILDVQSNVAGQLNEEDQLLLEGLCGQIAVAIESTRLLDEANRFRLLAETSGQGISMADLEGNVFYLNPVFSRMLGLNKPADGYGMNMRSFYSPETRERLHRVIVPTVLAVGQWTGELALVSKNGTVIPTIENFFVIRDDEGNAQYLASLITDISERKAAEDALSYEKSLLDALLAGTGDSIYFKDREARLTRISAKMAADLRAEGVEDYFGKTDPELFGEEFGRETLAADLHLMETGEPILGLMEQRSLPNGEYNYTSTTKVPLHDIDTGEVIGLVGITREINSIMQAEAQLAEERTLLRTLIDNIPDYIFFKDRESRIVLDNVAHAYQISGNMTPEEVVGKSDFDFFPPEMAQKFRDDEQRVMESGEPLLNIEEESLDGTGNPIWVQTTKIPLRDMEGNITGLIGVARDITARKKAEIERERLLASERQQRTLAETLAEVSMALTAQTDTMATLDQVLIYAQRLTPQSQALAIALLRGNRLFIDRWRGTTETDTRALEASGLFVEQALSLGEAPLIAEAIRRQEPIISQDIQQLTDNALTLTDEADWVRAAVFLPITLQDRGLGAIWLLGDREDAFDQDDITRLLPIINAAAIALENKRLLQEAQARARREERLNVISTQFQGQSTLPALLNIALQELGSSLDARKGRVRLNLDDDSTRSSSSNGRNAGSGDSR